MNNYPIEGLMNTAMNSIREMIDVNTIIGDPINTTNNISIIPVSKVNFGFASGGSEFNASGSKNIEMTEKKNPNEQNYIDSKLPFGGGAGAGVSISPVAFIVVQPTGVKLLPIEHSSAIDKLLDLVPDLIDKTITMVEKQTKKIENGTQTFQYKYNGNFQNNSGNKNQMSHNQDNSSSVNNPSKVTKVESKPYDIEYDETDM